jgi:hypothetical protein
MQFKYVTYSAIFESISLDKFVVSLSNTKRRADFSITDWLPVNARVIITVQLHVTYILTKLLFVFYISAFFSSVPVHLKPDLR